MFKLTSLKLSSVAFFASTRKPEEGSAIAASAAQTDTNLQYRPTTPVITVAGLTKTYPGTQRPAVWDLSLAVNLGETLALLGPSGCGKTTTLRLIAGFETPDSGDIRIRGQIMSSATTLVPPEKRGLGIIFQQFALFPHMTVLENVAYGLHKLKKKDRLELAREELERVAMGRFTDRYPHQLSGGQEQRVALARALAPKPLVLLMDEPFGSLDAGLRAEMCREVKSILVQREATTIIVSHNQEEAFSLADRVIILNDGRFEQLNTPDNIYHRPANRFVAQFVGIADFLPARLENGIVYTEVGNFPFEGTSPEGPLELLVRPDDIEFAVDDAGQGRIIDREFKGADNLYTVRLASGRSVRSVRQSTDVHEIGRRVRVSAEVSHIVLFKAEESRTP